MNKELVVAYYNENLNWLNDVRDYKITIYNKSNTEIPGTIKLENIGREMQTYFHHIVNNYDNLSEWVFFTQANPFDHVRNYKLILEDFPNSLVYNKLNMNDCYFFTDGVFRTKLVSLSSGRPHHFAVLDIDSLWKQLFKSNPIEQYEFVAGCIFCVSREQIRKRDKSFYEKCKKISEEVLMSPWEFERMMYYVFNNKIK